MRIRRIEVRNFRKLVGPLLIDELRDGLTVIAGDNEDGKSTLLHALRAALFLKHKSSVTDELLPFGSKVRPELRLELELGGKPYSLYKAFCQNPRAELMTPTGKLEGMAAEEELARLLRFETPQKASADPKSEHQGLCGLLWVTQGESFRNHQTASSLQRDLQSALESEVGSVLTGEIGRKLLAVFRDRYEQNFGKAGRPREALTHYQLFLRKSPDSPLRPETEAYIALVEAQLQAKQHAAQTVQSPAGHERTAAEPPTPAPAPGKNDAPTRPVYKRAWFYGVLAGSAVAVGLAVGLGVYFGTRPPSTTLGIVDPVF